ncbi:MAG: hypothetical protein ABSD42_12295 [Candidatus Bathyarchaeia archaeon]
MPLVESVGDSGFARSTVIIHLERLGSEELILKEKSRAKAVEGLNFSIAQQKLLNLKRPPQPNVIIMEFSKLKKACRYEKAGYCKLAKDKCPTQNCRLIMNRIKSIKVRI